MPKYQLRRRLDDHYRNPDYCSTIEGITSKAMSCSSEPTLASVLSGDSAEPWTLAALKKFLERNYCAEVLHFIGVVGAYREFYDRRITKGEVADRDRDNAATLVMWQHILDTYIVPNSEMEINISSDMRKFLMSHRGLRFPPSPIVLKESCTMMEELLAGIFMQFLESLRPSAAACCTDYANKA